MGKNIKYKIVIPLEPFREQKLQGNQLVYVSESGKHLQGDMRHRASLTFDQTWEEEDPCQCQNEVDKTEQLHFSKAAEDQMLFSFSPK